MKHALISIATVLALSVGAVGIALANEPTSVAILGRFTLQPFQAEGDDYTLETDAATDVVIQRYVVAPGVSTGWHTHPGPVFISVTEGTLTLYEGDDPSCTGTAFQAGGGFVDRGFGHVHLARNEGTTTVVGYATYTNVPVGGAFKILAPNPGNCAARGF